MVGSRPESHCATDEGQQFHEVVVGGLEQGLDLGVSPLNWWQFRPRISVINSSVKGRGMPGFAAPTGT